MELSRISEIYDRLGKLSLDLPLDPASMGPEFLMEQISICRNFLNEAGFYLQEVLQETSYVRMNLNGKETQYKIRSNQLLTQDRSVMALPSIADRHAKIDVILLEEKREIFVLQQDLDSLLGVEKVVTFRKRELDNTMSAIRLQRSLLRDQAFSGQAHGDESFKSRNLPPDPVDGMGAAELEAIIAEAEREADLTDSETRPVMLVSSSDEHDEHDDGDDMASLFADRATWKDAPPKLAIQALADFDLDALVAAGGIDGTFDDDVTIEAPQPVVVPPSAQPKFSSSDIDPEMERFLSTPDDDIDDILANV